MAMSQNGRTAAAMVGVVLVMGAAAWAAIPLYNLFCKVTGFAGTTAVAEAGSDIVLDKLITVRFDGSKAREMPWEFKPVQTEMTLHIGETGLAFFEAYNPTDRVITGQASYNVYPYTAGGYFNKIECFCFTEQTLQPHERVQMPVTFFVDPAIVNDEDGKYIREITLSYTFYEIKTPQASATDASQAALVDPAQPTPNEL